MCLHELNCYALILEGRPYVYVILPLYMFKRFHTLLYQVD